MNELIKKHILEHRTVLDSIIQLDESIAKVAHAINAKGGKEAVKLELGQKYIRSLTKLKGNGNNVIMGGNLANMKEMLKGLEIDI